MNTIDNVSLFAGFTLGKKRQEKILAKIHRKRIMATANGFSIAIDNPENLKDYVRGYAGQPYAECLSRGRMRRMFGRIWPEHCPPRSTEFASPFTQRIRQTTTDGLRLWQLIKRDNPGMMVGIEIECFIPTRIADQIDDQGIKLPLGVCYKGDGSLEPTSCDVVGREFTLVCAMNEWAKLYKLCALLDKWGATVNKTCGGHVHLDSRDLPGLESVKIRANQLHAAMGLLRYAVPSSRLGGSFCKIIRPAFQGDRYKAVNLTSYNQRKTIEIRLGSGSVNPDKIRAWSEICFWFSRHKARGLTTIESATDAVQWALSSKMPVHLKLWLVARIKQFHPSCVQFPDGNSFSVELSEQGGN